jgi:hypothetical protein
VSAALVQGYETRTGATRNVRATFDERAGHAAAARGRAGVPRRAHEEQARQPRGARREHGEGGPDGCVR